MDEFLNFNKMLTPTIIKVIFWIGVVGSVFMGITMILTGAHAYYGGGMAVFMGLVTLIIGPLLTRIYCELLIVMFKMNEHLQTIASNTKKDQSEIS